MHQGDSASRSENARRIKIEQWASIPRKLDGRISFDCHRLSEHHNSRTSSNKSNQSEVYHVVITTSARNSRRKSAPPIRRTGVRVPGGRHVGMPGPRRHSPVHEQGATRLPTESSARALRGAFAARHPPSLLGQKFAFAAISKHTRIRLRRAHRSITKLFPGPRFGT